jgi:hypothetical protein
VRLIGPFYNARLSPDSPKTPFFRGLRGSDEFVRVEADVAAALQKLQPNRVFFGPRMQWAYAAFGLPSPRNEPVWWHPGVSFGFDQEAEMVNRWRLNDHDVLIFYRQDRMYLSEEMLRIISEDYRTVPGIGTLTVFVARNESEHSNDRITAR